MLFIATVAVFVVVALFAVAVINRAAKKIALYENILDHIDVMVSVTDINNNSAFINKPVEEILGMKRAEAVGKPCGDLTARLESGGGAFKAEGSNLTYKNGKAAGYLEIIRDTADIQAGKDDDYKFIEDVNDISRSFLQSSRQIDMASGELANNSMAQAADVNLLSASITEVTAKTHANTVLAGRASALGHAIRENAEKGSVQMGKLAKAVEDINSSILSISNVFKFIDDIAFQTNILALNAAVEAARAGQHGKGFAVVAEEVRNLAAKSAESAKDTGSLITDSIERARMGVNIAGETSASFREIVSGINESNHIANDILKSCEEQDASIAGINKAIGGVSQSAQKNSATAEETAAAGVEMEKCAERLKELIDVFKAQADEYYN